jgi:hypothetical protein
LGHQSTTDIPSLAATLLEDPEDTFSGDCFFSKVTIEGTT